MPAYHSLHNDIPQACENDLVVGHERQLRPHATVGTGDAMSHITPKVGQFRLGECRPPRQ